MPRIEPDHWLEQIRQTLRRYDEPLLRQVANKLFKPRNLWPAAELVDRSLASISNVAVVDRRVQALEPGQRRLLSLIGHSRQPRWRVGSLLELLIALGHDGDPRSLVSLFESGLLYPELSASSQVLKSFETWIGRDDGRLIVVAPPQVTHRALGEDLGLPECPGAVQVPGAAVVEADGLDWPLRLAVLWQQIAAAPLRRTQQGDFFKRDLDRLQNDPLLSGANELKDAGLLAVELGLIEGLIREDSGELTAGDLPAAWDQGLPAALESLWAAVPLLSSWNVHDGWRGADGAVNPYPAAYLLSLLLLARLPEDAWADPDAVGRWVVQRHPYWAHTAKSKSTTPHPALTSFLTGLAYPLRLIQMAKQRDDTVVVRLSPLGRRLLGFPSDAPVPAEYPQTLLVQPNLEIIAYRQGLTPQLIGKLSRFTAWKSLGAACTLQLQPETVYRALESGQTFESILQTLEQHGMKATPPAVVESLRTWANKRERLGVYPSATLFEFNTPEDLNEALARGLPGLRLSDRIALVADESGIDFRHFRLTGTRDYALPPERCVQVEADGVTLVIDLTRSDLLLETELKRFAVRLDESTATPGRVDLDGAARRRYRLTPASLVAGKESGLVLSTLEEWFLQRSGQAISPAARLLLTGAQTPPLELRRRLVMHVDNAETADGLTQWPETRAFFPERLGPTALAVDEEHLPELRRRLEALGLKFKA